MFSQVQDPRSASSADALVESRLATERRRSGTEVAGVDWLTRHTALAAFVAERTPACRQGTKKPGPKGQGADYDSVEGRVVHGGLDHDSFIRADSPTCDLEGFELKLSFAASRRVLAAGATVTNT